VPLDDALAAEAEGRFLDALRLVRARLEAVPDDPVALNLLGRLCAGGGDLAAAIGLYRAALRGAPDDARARADLARALTALPDPPSAHAAYAAALGRAPQIALHHRHPGSLRPFAGMEEVRASLELALHGDPSLAAAHASLGNVLTREERFADALAAYRRAIALDVDEGAYHLAAGELAYVLGDRDAWARHRADALARGRVYPEPHDGSKRDVLVLYADGPWPVNVALDLLVDHERDALHRVFLDPSAPPALDGLRYDVVFNAVSEYEQLAPAIAAARRFADAQQRPVINPPEKLGATARPVLAAALRDVPGCVVPLTRRLTREEAETQREVPFPLAVRPVDAHGGRGLERVDDADALRCYLDTSPAERFDLTAFVDTRDPDGWYRKYRVVFVDGVAYPYHLAISSSWIVHYWSSAMTEHAWMREEEEQFLCEPRAVFPHWETTFAALGRAIGLDYFGIDCARTPGGQVLVYEADAAMLVHAHDRRDLFPYREPAVRRIADALEDLLARRGAAR
jgi:tetratricopeptide (TPR) repeat protein